MNNTLTLNLPISIRFKLNLSLKILWILSFVLIAVLLVFYVFQVNEMTKNLYLIKNCEKKIKNLSHEDEILKIKFSQVNSLKSLESLVQNLNYERVSQVYYIQVLEGMVVKQ